MPQVIFPVIGNRTRLPFYLTGIGVSEPEYHVLRTNGLESYQFLVTLGGEGIVKINNNIYTQKTGDCFFLSPGVPHEYYPAGSEWKTAWMVFRGNTLSAVMRSLGYPDYLLYESFDEETFLQLFSELYESAQDSLSGGEACSLLIYRIVLMMSSNFFENQNVRVSKREVIEAAVKFMDENFGNDISLEQLAEVSGVSKQHLCRCFKARMGMRPMEYLARRRLSEAKKLLVNTDRSILDIAGTVGYHGVTYFGMVFRRYEGMTPGEFRKSKGLLSV